MRTFSAEGDGDGGAAVFEGDSVCAASVTSSVTEPEVSEDVAVSGMDGSVKGAVPVPADSYETASVSDVPAVEVSVVTTVCTLLSTSKSCGSLVYPGRLFTTAMAAADAAKAETISTI